MTTGFKVFNNNGFVQIDDNFKNPRLVATGTIPQATAGEIDLGVLGINLDTEIPLVMVRPHNYDRYVGGAYFSKVHSNGTTFGNYVGIDADRTAYDYAIFSTVGSPISDGGTLGMVVRNPSDVVVYDSRYVYPRLLSALQMAASSNYNYPLNYGISGYSEMPWILVNPLIWQQGNINDFNPINYSGIFMKVNSLTSITIDHLVLGQYSGQNGLTMVAAHGGEAMAYNPYHLKSAVFVLGTFN